MNLLSSYAGASGQAAGGARVAAETGAAAGHRSLRSGSRVSRRASPHARRRAELVWLIMIWRILWVTLFAAAGVWVLVLHEAAQYL